jgi:ribosomal protein S18 acetylase RimI-like enzyme
LPYGARKGWNVFLPAQLAEGVYFGIRADGRLVAAAGTHLVNCAENAAAIGNVFCLPECRGQGLGSRVTSAVVDALVKDGIQTIGLNVGPDNPPLPICIDGSDFEMPAIILKERRNGLGARRRVAAGHNRPRRGVPHR